MGSKSLLGSILGRFWVGLGRFGEGLGGFGRVLGPIWEVWGRVFGCDLRVLGRFGVEDLFRGAFLQGYVFGSVFFTISIFFSCFVCSISCFWLVFGCFILLSLAFSCLLLLALAFSCFILLALLLSLAELVLKLNSSLHYCWSFLA